MNIQFKPNIQFTKIVKTEGRLREFNFRKLGGLNEGIFTVDVVDDRGNRIMFRMQKDDANQWKIIPESQLLPGWITNAGQHLHELIEESSR